MVTSLDAGDSFVFPGKQASKWMLQTLVERTVLTLPGIPHFPASPGTAKESVHLSLASHIPRAPQTSALPAVGSNPTCALGLRLPQCPALQDSLLSVSSVSAGIFTEDGDSSYLFRTGG